MPDLGSIGDIILSKRTMFYIFCAFMVLVILVTVVLLYHWAKYAKETDMKYRLVQLVYIVGVIFFVLVAFSFYMLL